jgi:hypothetical protein
LGFTARTGGHYPITGDPAIPADFIGTGCVKCVITTGKFAIDNHTGKTRSFKIDRIAGYRQIIPDIQINGKRNRHVRYDLVTFIVTAK